MAVPAAPEWSEIVQHNVANVTNAALRVLGCISDAEDVAQDVFLEAFRNWNASEAHAWAGLLRRMAVCRALDLLRTRRKSEPLGERSLEAAIVSAEEHLLLQERHQLLRQAVGALPAREAEVFCLACYECQSHKEIADLLQIERSAVAVLLSKAKTRLTEAMCRLSGDVR